MKYSINKSKIDSVILKYLDLHYNPKYISWDHPVDFFTDEYGDEHLIPNSTDRSKIMYFKDGNVIFTVDLDNGPNIEIYDDEVASELTSMFGELWVEPFRKWFLDNYKIDLETITLV